MLFWFLQVCQWGWIDCVRVCVDRTLYSFLLSDLLDAFQARLILTSGRKVASKVSFFQTGSIDVDGKRQGSRRVLAIVKNKTLHQSSIKIYDFLPSSDSGQTGTRLAGFVQKLSLTRSASASSAHSSSAASAMDRRTTPDFFRVFKVSLCVVWN